jgi:hydrogenase-4 component B
MPLLALAVLAFTRIVAGQRLTVVRRVPPWQSATAGVDGPASYTASGFANPTRRILGAVLHTRSRAEAVAPDQIEVVESYLYRPLLPIVLTIVRTARKLQSGRLDAYLAYMLIALVGLLAVVVAFAR